PVAGFFDNYKIAAPSTATILRQNGYHTAYFGKWHCGVVHDQKSKNVCDAGAEIYPGCCNRTPERHRAGFQDWFGFENINSHFNSYYYENHNIVPTRLNGYETDALTDLSIGYLEKYNRDEPLFMVLSVTPPHFPMIVPDKWKRFNPNGLQVPPNFSDTPEMRDNLAIYYAMIENLDWNIGRLVEAIEALPAFRDTIFIYVSDHGDFMGSHGRALRKEYPHEESVRIPAILKWPGHIPKLGTVPGLFSLVDLLPTTLGLVGIPIPEYVQGVDYSPQLFDLPFNAPDSVLLEMVGVPRWTLDYLDWRGIATYDWKYAFFESGEELLFDLRNDPFEMNNLASKQSDIRVKMKIALLTLLEQTREPFFDVIMNYGAPMNQPDIDVSK
ncbi:MAG: sulfatase-like hydrolase/transferase, partial [Victivallales bacterium]